LAIYRLSIKIISRGKGKSAVAAAAYRSGEKITSEYDGLTHDYTRKGGIVHTEILLPEHAPKEYADRSILWNAVERIEKNINSQLSREIELALPVELSAGQNISLVREYVKRHFVEKGMCADICVHDKNDGNPHAHIMLTMRPLEQDGSWAAKSKKEYILDENGERIRLKSGAFKTRKINTVDWNDQTKAEEWRGGWAEIVNRFLEQNNIAERIDHRSYERQGIEQIPTVHMGVAASQMERRGIATERGNINRQIKIGNRELRQLRARINKLKKWLDEEAESSEPNLQDVISEILNGREGKTHWQKTADLKTAAKVLIFLQTNGITELPQLQEKVTDIRGLFDDVRAKLNKSERRLTVLREHIKQAEIYREHEAVYTQYQQQKPKNREAFYECHRREIILFEAAKKYLDEHLNGHPLSLKAWKVEDAKLTAEKDNLYGQFYRLKEEVRDVEVIRRCVEQIMRDELRVKRGRTHEAEL